MKKYLSIALSTVILSSSLFLHSNVKAAENVESLNKISEIEVTNESEYIESLKKLSDKELMEKGASKSEIKEIREADLDSLLDERVESLQEKSKGELLEQGYSLKQIDMIENYAGTQAQTLGLLASLSGTLTIATKSATSSLSTVKGYYSFTWSKAPLILIKDFIAITWSEGFYLNTTSGYSRVSYNYYNIGKDTHNKQNDGSIKQHLNVGATTSFGMGYRDQEEVGIYTKTGAFWFHLEKKAKVAEMAVQSEYGHTTIAVGSPSVSIPAGLSVTFSYQVSEEDSDYKKVNF